MMRLIAIRQIRSGCGSIEPEQAFVAGEREAERLIKRGDAMPELAAAQRPYQGGGYWTVQPEWKGQTAIILAGGPSMSREQVETVVRTDLDSSGIHRVIAINNAATLAPWADILYFCDDRWYEWHRDLVRQFAGLRVTLENVRLQKAIEVRCLRDYGVTGFAPKADGVTNGRNSGYQALHLAALLGAARVLLLGFDMRAVDGQMHWHDEHPVRTPANIFEGWLACFNSLAPELAKRGVEVINCTPGSALKVFPQMSLEEALGVSANASVDQDAAPEPLYAPLRIEYPSEPPPSNEEAKPESEADPDQVPQHELVVTPEHDGRFGGAGASGSWADENASAPNPAPDLKEDA